MRLRERERERESWDSKGRFQERNISIPMNTGKAGRDIEEERHAKGKEGVKR